MENHSGEKSMREMPDMPGKGGMGAIFKCGVCGRRFVRTMAGQAKCEKCLLEASDSEARDPKDGSNPDPAGRTTEEDGYIYCPVCRSKNVRPQKFCTECGSRLL